MQPNQYNVGRNGKNSTEYKGGNLDKQKFHTKHKKYGLYIFCNVFPMKASRTNEKEKEGTLLLATIRDDTWKKLNMQHITPNSKLWNGSHKPGVTLKIWKVRPQSLRWQPPTKCTPTPKPHPPMCHKTKVEPVAHSPIPNPD